jgi:hypothetical protein
MSFTGTGALEQLPEHRLVPMPTPRDEPLSYGTTLAEPSKDPEEQAVVTKEPEEYTGFLSGTVAGVVLLLGTDGFGEQTRLIAREPTDRSGFYFGIATGFIIVLLVFLLVILTS